MSAFISVRSVFGGAAMLAVSLVLGCAPDAAPEELDPAGALGNESWGDDGPPASEVTAGDDSDLSTSVDAVSVSRIELPFPCGQVWAGQTRSNHSPANAVDFNRTNDIGDVVVASAAGVVTRVANEGSVSYGRWIEVDHGDGYRTRYAHLSAQLVRVGQRVSGGQAIGNVGSTGGSTGPHLHFELLRNGAPVRPMFHGASAFFWGTRNYTSQNSCAGGAAAGVVGRVNTNGVPLTVRTGPSQTTAAVGTVANGATVRISCQVRGASVRGTYGTSTLWDRVGNGYISDAYVSTGSDGQVAPTCR